MQILDQREELEAFPALVILSQSQLYKHLSVGFKDVDLDLLVAQSSHYLMKHCLRPLPLVICLIEFVDEFLLAPWVALQLEDQNPIIALEI